MDDKPWYREFPELEQLYLEHKQDVLGPFPKQPAKLPSYDIDLLPGAQLPRNRGVRPQSQQMQNIIDAEIDQLLQDDCIEPSTAPAASQILPVLKPDGTWRTCVDYRRLNEITINQHYPLPLIDQIINEIAGKQFYSILDLLKGYYQIAVSPRSRIHTAFVTKKGCYQWKRLPMGVKNATRYFQMHMQHTVLTGLEHICKVYLDDLIIFGNTWEEHWANVSTVLHRLKEYGLVVKGHKCQWGKTEVQYLGIIVNRNGHRLSESRKEALLNMPKPVTQAQLHSFIGLCIFFAKYTEKLAHLLKPLNAMKKKAANKVEVIWTPEAHAAWDAIKNAIRRIPMLTFLKPTGEVRLYTDASEIAISGFLCQVVNGIENPVYFISKALTGSQLNWSTCDKEMYAIVYCILRLHYYIASRDFVVRTDHRNLM